MDSESGHIIPENRDETAGPSISDSESEVREPNQSNRRRSKKRQDRCTILLKRQRKMFEKMLDIAIRKKRLQLDYMRKELEMKRQLHNLKMQMLRSELDFKKRLLALMNVDIEDVNV
ncbi:uncharacterized protein LOC123011239 [Tribolium madens]|uniref:uncharacterized protein LOC123011239 n=1 Tax=Tribolium madens TaxID=41895 RepID=UPI001CF75A9B|nr:uncharacterized protein LOC123011239 [Tribolium madens]